MNSNGVCTKYNEILEKGVKEYSLLKEEGSFLATLKFRSWGRKMNLACFFKADDGRKFYLYAWRIKGGDRNDRYCPRDSWPDFAAVEDGTRWLIEMKKSRNGNVFWSTAKKL